MSDSIRDRISGAARTNDIVNEALTPDADGIARIDRDEMSKIVTSYSDSAGGLLDGRDSTERHADRVKPALGDALDAVRAGNADAYSVYLRSQVRRDLAGGRAPPGPAAPPPPRDEGALAGGARMVRNILGRGDSFAADVNEAGGLAERLLPQIAAGGALGDGEFAQLRNAARDESTFTFLSQRVSSVEMEAFRYLRNNPNASKSDFVQYVRGYYPA